MQCDRMHLPVMYSYFDTPIKRFAARPVLKLHKRIVKRLSLYLDIRAQPPEHSQFRQQRDLLGKSDLHQKVTKGPVTNSKSCSAGLGFDDNDYRAAQNTGSDTTLLLRLHGKANTSFVEAIPFLNFPNGLNKHSAFKYMELKYLKFKY